MSLINRYRGGVEPRSVRTALATVLLTLLTCFVFPAFAQQADCDLMFSDKPADYSRIDLVDCVFENGFEACVAEILGYPDLDLDGFGDPAGEALMLCLPLPYGYADNSLDCDDGNDAMFPGNVELCDALDNNCNETVDEGFPDLGYLCSVGVGTCQRQGFNVCSADGSGTACNAVPGAPQAEICDGLDNDCNGMVDDPFPNLGQSCSVGFGICRSTGSYACSSDGSAAVCDAVAGVPQAEVCDGLDNNCNGSVDEPFPDLGNLCSVGAGTCQRMGFNVCSADGSGTACNAVPGAPQAEICDGLDNNCNGSVDEPFPNLGEPCSVGLGICRSFGSRVCSADGSATACSAVAGEPQAEICDGLDNNCNGSVDEPFHDLGNICSVGVGICRGFGSYVCSTDGSATVCNAVAGEPQAEVCGNGLDDDCDGSVDEGC